MPSSGTYSIGTSGRDYSTISGWEADTDVSLTGMVVGECYNDSDFDEPVNMSGASNDSFSQHRHLTVAEGERHDGTAGTGARINWSNGANDSVGRIITTNDTYPEVSWLEVTHTTRYDGGHFGGTEPTERNYNQWHHILMYGLRVGPNGVLFCLNTNNAQESYVWSCIAYDSQSESGVYDNTPFRLNYNDIEDRSNSATYVRNCTSDNHQGGEQTYGFAMWAHSGATCQVKNCVSTNNAYMDFHLVYNDGTLDYDNNASEDGTADTWGTGNITGLTPSNEFVDVGSGTEDYHLLSTSQLVDAGVDLGDVRGKIDIDNRDRHGEGVTWDIGADEEELDPLTRNPRALPSVGRALHSVGRALTHAR